MQSPGNLASLAIRACANAPRMRRMATLMGIAVLLAAQHLPAGALGASAPAASAPAAAPPAIREEGVRWQKLTPVQRQVLAPLEREWPGIDAPRKQKWLALSARFDTLAPAERQRITARMVEWAKLTPAERGQARLRYEESRQVPATDRTARWQAYQALPADARQKLVARAASAAASNTDAARRDSAAAKSAKGTRDAKEAKVNIVPNAALAQQPRQVAPTLMQAAPGATTTLITRRPTPPAHQQTGMPKIAATPEFVNRATLLPQRGPQAAAVRSGTTGLPANVRVSSPIAVALPPAASQPAPATIPQ